MVVRACLRLLSAMVYLRGGVFSLAKNLVIWSDPQGLGLLGCFSRLSSILSVLVMVSHRLARVACTVLERTCVLPWSWHSVKSCFVVVYSVVGRT